MKKLKNVFLKTGKYLREISVIVIGVAITLSVSQWINNRSQRQDIAIHLSAIKTELEENIELLENNIIKFHLMPEVKYVNYLLSLRDGQPLNADSILSHLPAWAFIAQHSLQSIAFESLKNSGLMHLINDRELQLLLWEMDFYLAGVNYALELHFQEKWNAMKKEDWSDLKEVISHGRQKISVAPMYNFFIINPFIEFGFSHAIVQTAERYLNTARKTLAKLESLK